MQPSTLLKIRIAYAIIGLLVGLSICLVFGPVYHNWSTAGWGFMSGVFAFLTLLQHLEYRNDEWRSYYICLNPLFVIGLIGQVFAIAGLITYLVFAAKKSQSLTPYNDGYYLTSIWCFITWKWAFMCMYFARKYKQLYMEYAGYQPL